MSALTGLSIFWIGYGIFCFFGTEFTVPTKFRKKPWKKAYSRKKGFAFLLLGTLWLIFCLLSYSSRLDYYIEIIILVACAVPSFVFSFFIDRKYKMLDKSENE